jgi:YidC/Oxa1 family membrane protein insertase
LIGKRALETPLRIIAFLLLLGLVGTGCAPGGLGSGISVPEDASAALAQGAAKEKAASDVAAGNQDEAIRLRTEAAAYYGAVAHKFAGSQTGLQALLKQGQLLQQNKSYPQAQVAFRDAERKYPGSEEAKTLHQALLRTMDEQNSRTPYYQAMDALVRLLGGSHVLAILFISLGLTLVLWPLRVRQYRGMKEMQRHAPELKKIQEKYKDDRALQMEKVQEFYREHGFNPAAGCLPLVAQMPILWGVYYAISLYQYKFVGSHFLWINPAASHASAAWPPPLAGAIARDLSQQDLLLLFVYALSMYVQTRLTPPTDPTQADQQKVMAVVMPVMFFVMMLQWHLPSAFVLYWFLSNIFSVSQQWWIMRHTTLTPLSVTPGLGGAAAVGPDNGSAAATTNGANAAPAPGNALSPNKRIVSPKGRRRIRKK